MRDCVGSEKTTAIIPAAGDGRRWGNYLGTVKQLVPVGVETGESVILRTIRMLNEAGISNVYVVTDVLEIITEVQSVAQVIRPEKSQYLSDTILSSKDVWSEKTLILLGDVYFSRECIEAMVHCEKEFCFWGLEPSTPVCKQNLRRPEIYGLSFCNEIHQKIQDNLVLNSSLSEARDSGFLLGRAMKLGWRVFNQFFKQNCSPRYPSLLRKFNFSRNDIWRASRLLRRSRLRNGHRYGKLWGLYLTISDIDPFSGRNCEWPENRTGDFIQIDDQTQDIDIPQDYLALLASLRRHRSLCETQLMGTEIK
jgi:hypothetical protein